MANPLSAEIRRVREARGWSRARLEREACVPSRSVERLELKGHSPRGDVLLRLCGALGLDAGALVAGEAGPGLAVVLDGLVAEHGAEQVLAEAVRAAFRGSA